MGTLPDQRWKVLVCLGLALGTLAIYWPVRHYDFIAFDDQSYVAENSHLRAGLNPEALKWAFNIGYASNWHPLTWLSHMVDVQLFGLNAGPHHTVNVLFHTANALLLFLVLARLTRALWPSASVAALFAWHPLHVESVAWISERKDVLSTCFGLLTLWAYAQFVESGKRSRLWAALGCFALGLMGKPMLVTLPFLLLLLDYWPLSRGQVERPSELNTPAPRKGRREPTPPPAEVPSVTNWSSLFVEKTPFFVLSALSCVVTLVAQRQRGAVVSLELVSFGERLANALISYARYLLKTVWPSKLAVLYPHPGEWPEWQVAAAFVLLATISAATVHWAKRRPWVLVGWLWFLGTLVPVIGLVQVGSQSMADRYTYLPLIGLFIIAAWGLAECVSAFRLRPVSLALIAGPLLFALLWFTAAQVRVWRNSQTIFEHTIAATTGSSIAQKSGGNPFTPQALPSETLGRLARLGRLNPSYVAIYFSLGGILTRQGRFSEASLCYQETLRLKPDHALAHSDLGNALTQLGRHDEAFAHFAEATGLDPKLLAAQVNWGFALASQGSYRAAIDHYRAALRIEPRSVVAHFNAGDAHMRLGQADEAIQHFTEAQRLDANFGPARVSLGLLLARISRLDEAAAQFSELVRRNPDDGAAHYYLASVLSNQQRMEEALGHFRAAVRLQPNWPEALDALAWQLSTHPDARWRKGAEAVSLAERACALTRRKNPAHVNTLAAAYAEAGRFAEAESTADAAARLAGEAGQPELAAQIRQRQQLYQTRQPYREPAGVSGVSRPSP